MDLAYPELGPVVIDDQPTRLLGPRALAEFLDCHVDTLRRWRREGRISTSSYVRLGDGVYRYRLEGVLTDLQTR